MRAAYRVRQFWWALTGRLSPAVRAEVEAFLPPELWALFVQMQRSEQYHAWQVWQAVRAQSGDHSGDFSDFYDLEVAALLHDVGKIRCRLWVWERVLVVLGRRFFPMWAHDWERGELRGWGRGFVVAAHHAGWGAELVEQAGGSRLAVWLIRFHQDPPVRHAHGDLLKVLIRADDGH